MIIVEQNFHNVLAETHSDTQKLYLKGVFMEAEETNRNGRRYARDEISSAVDHVNEAAQEGRFILGELDHPAGRLEVHAQKVSHKLVEMTMNGNQAYGKAEILTELPMGKIAKGLIESGVQLGMSSRGTGSVNSDGTVSGFRFKTVDIVVEPSANNAYPESITESLAMYRRGDIVKDVALMSAHDPMAQKYLNEELNQFIAQIFKR